MDRIHPLKMPTVSVIYLFVCATLVLAFLVVGIHPYRAILEGQNAEIFRIQAQIEDQKVLQPVYTGLVERMRNGEATGEAVLPKTALPLDRIDQISSLVGEIARKHGLQLVTATPDVKALSKNSKLLTVYVVMQGDFLAFRKVLLDLVELPYVEHTEELQIQETAQGKEFKLKIWLAIDGAKEDVKA